MKLRGGKQQPAGRQRRAPMERPVVPSAFSYYSKRAERPDAPGRQQSSLARHRYRLLLMRFWAKRSSVLIAVVVAVLLLTFMLGLSTKPRIVLLKDNGGSQAFHAPSDYQAAAVHYLSSSIWNRNKITVDSGAVGAALKRQFPELATATVSLPLFGRQPTVYLHANTPAFVLQAINGNYVLDSDGKALLTKDAATGSKIARLPTITDQTGLHVQLGQHALSSSEADFVQTVVATLAAKHMGVSSLVLPAGAVQELDIQIGGQPYTIKFNMHDTGSARQQVGTYLATINTLAGEKRTPAQYIDVRVLGRAYYQ